MANKNYWQHEDTGTVSVCSQKPSARHYRISKKAYEQKVAAEHSVQRILLTPCEHGYPSENSCPRCGDCVAETPNR